MQSAKLQLKIQKNEDELYVIKCPNFEGCYTQGQTLAQALKNIKEVISLCLEEKNSLGK